MHQEALHPTVCGVQRAGGVLKTHTVTPAEPNAGDAPARNATFATTHWSVVLAADQTQTPDADQALARLCQTYWLPIYSFLRRHGSAPEDAEDLTQGFFARLLAKDYFSHANPDRGRFRTFLLSSLRHFLADAHDRQSAAKRGGGKRPLTLDLDGAETALGQQPIDALTPERLYEKRWALTLIEVVLDRLGEDFAHAGRIEFFAELKGYVWGEQTTTPYRDIAARFGLTENAVRVTVHRLRKRFRELLRLEIAHTVTQPEEIDDEIRYLATVLRG